MIWLTAGSGVAVVIVFLWAKWRIERERFLRQNAEAERDMARELGAARLRDAKDLVDAMEAQKKRHAEELAQYRREVKELENALEASDDPALVRARLRRMLAGDKG